MDWPGAPLLAVIGTVDGRQNTTGRRRHRRSQTRCGDRLGQQHPTGLTHRPRVGRVDLDAWVEPGTVTHLEGAPRTCDLWVLTIHILAGQGHFSVVRHRLKAVPHEISRLGVPWRPILLFGLVILVFYAADTGVLTWSSVYLHDALDATKSVAPFAFAAYETGAIVSRFGGDFLVRRHGAAFVVRLGATIGVAGLVGVVAAPAPPLAIAGFFVTGLGLAILAPLSFGATAVAVGPAAVDVAIARLKSPTTWARFLAVHSSARQHPRITCAGHSSYRWRLFPWCWSSQRSSGRPTSSSPPRNRLNGEGGSDVSRVSKAPPRLRTWGNAGHCA